MTWINSMAKGEWGKGLSEMVAGSFGGRMFDVARGNMTLGKAAAETGTDVATAAVSLIPGAGPAVAIAKAGAQAGMQMGNAAIQGGSTSDIMKAGALSAAGSAGGAAVGKVGGKITNKVGTPTGGAAPMPTANNTAPLPNAPELRGPIAEKSGLLNNINTKISNSKPGQFVKKVNTKISNTSTKVSNSKVGKVVGQVGVQGALSIASGIQAGKQAKAANEVSRQGLLFQQQTYNEQVAEREKAKTKLKTDAQTAYKSATLFGETLSKNTPSENLLTNYTSENTGSYSIFSTGLSVKKSTDLT